MKRNTLFNKRQFFTSILIACLSISSLAQDRGYFTITLEMLTDLSSTSLQPENETLPSKEFDRYFTESAENDELTPKGGVATDDDVPSYFRLHKELPSEFSGYVIELLQSEKKLARNYPLFERFGNIHVTQLKNGFYSYCIIANFNKSNRVKIFAEEVIAPQAPQAQALKYKRGKRKKL